MTARTLYVGGLAGDADGELLRSLFAEYGELTDTRVMRQPPDGPCRGFGYVTFRNRDSATRARCELDGYQVCGRPIRVELAT